MLIRTRLTLQFFLFGGIIMIVASAAIYLFSADFRRDEFRSLLRSRSEDTAKLVLDSYEFNINQIIRSGFSYPTRLQAEKIVILNSENDTLYISDRKWQFRNINSLIAQVKQKGDISSRQDDYEVIGALHTTRDQQFVVLAAAVDRDGLMHLRKMVTMLLLVSAGSLLLFSIAGWFYSGRALKPISDMVKKVEEISITSLNLRIPEGNGLDEIGRLAITFNRMLERLEKSFATQKDFIANASHELRTPLTSINGQIEVLLMKDRSAPEYKSALESVLEDIRSLIDLSNRLLLIARTSGETHQNPKTKIRIDEVLWQVHGDMKKFNKDCHIKISIDESLTDSDQMAVMADEYLIRVAFLNIIENACKFSSDHTVEVVVRHPGKLIEIIFTDKGIGIPEEEISKVFEPFYRGSNAISTPGSGIGLSLVDRIIRNHNGTLRILSQPGAGTTVIIKLHPLA